MNLVLSGPMRGVEGYNHAAFDDYEAVLRKMGHNPVNPANHDRKLGFDTAGEVTQEYLREVLAWDLGQVCRSDGVVVLAGWRHSRGARAEVATARAVGLPIYILVRSESPHLRECSIVGF